MWARICIRKTICYHPLPCTISLNVHVSGDRLGVYACWQEISIFFSFKFNQNIPLAPTNFASMAPCVHMSECVRVAMATLKISTGTEQSNYLQPIPNRSYWLFAKVQSTGNIKLQFQCKFVGACCLLAGGRGVGEDGELAKMFIYETRRAN